MGSPLVEGMQIVTIIVTQRAQSVTIGYPRPIRIMKTYTMPSTTTPLAAIIPTTRTSTNQSMTFLYSDRLGSAISSTTRHRARLTSLRLAPPPSQLKTHRVYRVLTIFQAVAVRTVASVTRTAASILSGTASVESSAIYHRPVGAASIVIITRSKVCTGRQIRRVESARFRYNGCWLTSGYLCGLRTRTTVAIIALSISCWVNARKRTDLLRTAREARMEHRNRLKKTPNPNNSSHLNRLSR